MYKRKLLSQIKSHLNRGKSILLLGPRQVGKTTLLKQLDVDLKIDLLNVSERLRYEKTPDLIYREVENLKNQISRQALIVIDEIQKVPDLLDPIQSLIDKNKGQFILTGSSARKLKRQADINLLPGRTVTLRLDALLLDELFEINVTKEEEINFNELLKEILYYGTLPGIRNEKDPSMRDLDLKSYVESYLDEEIRKEAEIRKLGPFANFLQLAALESGNIINFSEISKDIGVSKNTIVNYFEVLFDTLIAEKIEPVSKSLNRKKLIKSPRFLFFDLGVRRLAAQEWISMTPDRLGKVFEQFVGLELSHQLRIHHPLAKLKFWCDPDGPEVDWIIDFYGEYVPIEVKWSTAPTNRDANHLKKFCEEYKAKKAYIICQTPRSYNISENIIVVPWQKMENLSFLM